MRESLLTEIYNNQLIAIGYQQSPSTGRTPVIIDSDKFEQDNPNWHRGTLKAHGIEYDRIRVAAPNRPQSSNDAGQPKGSKLAIETAIKQLQNSDPQFGKNLRQRDCQKVRDYLNARSMPGNGLSDQNISKAIVRICGSKAIKSKSN